MSQAADRHPHAVWTVDDPWKLSDATAKALEDPANDLLLSAATVWELAIKIGQGKLTLSLPYRQWMDRAIADLELGLLPMTVEYAERQAALPPHHKDPFDRLIIAQAPVGGETTVVADTILDRYGIARLW